MSIMPPLNIKTKIKPKHCNNKYCSGEKLKELNNMTYCEYLKHQEEIFNKYQFPDENNDSE